MTVMIFGLILLGLGIIIAWLGADAYEEVIFYIGVITLVTGFVIMLFGAINSDEKTDKHVRITYEDLCYEYGGEYLNLEGKNTCIVEE